METGTQCDTRVYLVTGRCKTTHWVNWIGSLANTFAITLLSLMIMLTPAHADGNIPSIGQGWIGVVAGCRPTIPEACNYDMMPDPPYVNGCRLGNSGYWRAAVRCPLCPPNTSPLDATTCACNFNFVPDSTRTSCVPVTTCTIPDLTPLTDPVAIDFDNNPGGRWRPDGLSPDYQVKLTCVTDGIDAATGRTRSYTGTSAYRPAQYQRHLYEIITKDVELDSKYMTANPECQALRDKITKKMKDHELKYDQKVAIPGSSRHEAVPATAFDLTPIGLTKAQMAPIYARCGVSNAVVRNEPWHTQ